MDYAAFGSVQTGSYPVPDSNYRNCWNCRAPLGSTGRLFDVRQPDSGMRRIGADLSQSAQKELANLITLLFGLTVSTEMQWQAFLNPQTLMIMGLGLIAFIFDTAGGVLFAKFLNLLSEEENQPHDWCGGHFCVPHVFSCGAYKWGWQKTPVTSC